MRTDKIRTTAPHRKPDANIGALIILITTVTTSGFTLMFGTAFAQEFSTWTAIMFSLAVSTVCTVLFFINKKWLTSVVLIAPPAALVTAAFLDILNVQKGLSAFLYILQFYSFYLLPGEYVGGMPESSGYCFMFILAYDIVAISLTTYFLTRRKLIPLSLLLYAPLFVCAVSNTAMRPDTAPSIAGITGVFLILLAHACRNKTGESSGRVLLLLAVPAALFPIITGLIFPQATYDKDTLAELTLISMKEKAEEMSQPLSEFIDTVLNGAKNPHINASGNFLTTLSASDTNLDTVGPFNPSYEEVMTVRKEPNPGYTGTDQTLSSNIAYLKIESLDIYQDNKLKSWKIKGDIYDKDANVSPVIAPYTITVTPLIGSSVDIVPYYTDFYYTDDADYKTVSAYNTTNTRKFVSATSPVPVKTGNIYSKKYLDDYVYNICLNVPKTTEDEIIETCNLPDWYLDVYYGRLNMSDTEKVRRVTEYVSGLHPYSKDTSYPPQGVDFVPWFIRDASSGICVHYAATSMILLRMIDVPARYVRGYLTNNAWPGTEGKVTTGDSHAWFEFFSPECGWIMGDATPGNEYAASSSNVNRATSEYPDIARSDHSEPDATDDTTETTETTETTAETNGSETSQSETSGSDTTDQTSDIDATEDLSSSDPVTDSDASYDNPDTGDSLNTGNKPSTKDSDNDAMLIVLTKTFQAIMTVLVTAISIILLAALARFIYVAFWHSRFNKETPAEKAVEYYHYYSFLGRVLKFSQPKKARMIAEKAAFSEKGITSNELGILVWECKKNLKAVSTGFYRIKKILYKVLSIKITAGD